MTWAFNQETQCFERILGDRRFVWVNGQVLSFAYNDETYMDTVFDALDPKTQTQILSKGQTTLSAIAEWEDGMEKPDPELFPGGVPPLHDVDWCYDPESGFYMKSEGDERIVYYDGVYLHYTAGAVEEGIMHEELKEIRERKIKLYDTDQLSEELEAIREYEEMWGLDEYDDGYRAFYQDGVYYCGGAMTSGYDVDDDLEGLKEKESHLEDK